MPTYLEIAVNVPHVADVFHYHLPPELEGQVDVGHLVVVPFGRQKVQGVVLRFVDQPVVPETRPVLELVDQVAVLTTQQIALAQALSEETLAPLANCINLMLPSGLGQQADVEYRLIFHNDQRAAGGRQKESSEILTAEWNLNDTQKRLVSLLEKRGTLRGRQIEQALPRLDWRAAARGLARRGLLSTRSVLPPPSVQPKLVRTAQLACPPEVAEAAMTELGRAGSAALLRRQAMLRFLVREPGPVDVAWIYADSGGDLGDLRRLAENGLVILGESETWRDPLVQLEYLPNQPPALTRDQQAVWDQLEPQIQAAAAGKAIPPLLLHGVTGSGKTELYLRAVNEVICLGKQAIVLVPEIALTPQTVRRFVGRFPGRVGLMHSGLSAGERFDTWRRVRLGQLSIVVGPRSALFMPFSQVGIIVVDEFHDDSYYQADLLPHYHASLAAVIYARLSGAVCLLGSATPDVASAYQAKQGRWLYLGLPARILAHRQVVQSQLERLNTRISQSSMPDAAQPLASHYHPLEGQAETIDLPAVQVIDMRQELQAGNRSIFSRPLQAALSKVLEQGQQAILFLNRRGTATYIFCRSCGHTLKCPRCDIPLTFHADTRLKDEDAGHTTLKFEPANLRSTDPQLICHYCAYQRKLPRTCPECGSPHIRQYGTGTERVETEVQALFPEARILRWDHETTRQKGAHEVILGHFSAQRADVLVGTQMLAKGLDLPFVTLVGVVLADVGLSLPDYRAPERTFQVLTQVAGRAGRSPLGGQVILQTFQPEHYAIQAAAGHDYKAFYQQEMEYRRRLGYPPFAQLARLEYRHKDLAQAERVAQSLASQIRGWLAAEDRRATQMIGPAPCFFARLGGFYRWQIILRGPDPASLLKNRNLGDWRIEANPISLL